MDREWVRQLSAGQFDTERIIEIVIAVLATVREFTLSDGSMEIDTICKTLRISRLDVLSIRQAEIRSAGSVEIRCNSENG